MARCSEPAQFTAVQQRLASAQATSAGLQAQVVNGLSASSAAVLRPMEEERAVGLAQVSALAVSGVAGANAEVVVADAARAGRSGDTSVEALLSQLRNEPSQEEECAAKFKLYETFFTQVEEIRSNLLKFYE